MHGAILTTWFALFFVQTSLVAAGRTDIHRRLGMVVSLFAIVVIAGSLLATLGQFLRVRARFPTGPFDVLVSAVSPTVWTNFASLVAFVTFVAAAILLHRRPDAHKRLMFLASFSILSPALSRISGWAVFGGVENPRFGLVVLLLVLTALVVNDVVSLRRVHPATLIAGGFRLLLVLVQGGIARSDFGLAVVRGIGRFLGVDGESA